MSLLHESVVDPDRPLKGMRKQELIELLERERQLMRLDRRARQLAASLMQQLGLFPNGIDLVCWLDAPGATSNLSAMTVWIRRHLECPEFAYQTQSTPERVLLLDHLHRTLARFEASFAP